MSSDSVRDGGSLRAREIHAHDVRMGGWHFPRLHRLWGLVVGVLATVVTLNPADAIEAVRNWLVLLRVTPPAWLTTEQLQPIALPLLVFVAIAGFVYCFWPARREKVLQKPADPDAPVVRIVYQSAVDNLSAEFSLRLYLTLVNSEDRAFEIGRVSGNFILYPEGLPGEEPEVLDTPMLVDPTHLAPKGQGGFALILHLNRKQISLAQRSWRTRSKFTLRRNDFDVELIDPKGKAHNLSLPDGFMLRKFGGGRQLEMSRVFIGKMGGSVFKITGGDANLVVKPKGADT